MLLITGAAGFIGFHLAKKYLSLGDQVIGIDNLNDLYYDASLKHARLEQLSTYPDFTFEKIDIANRKYIDDIFVKYTIKNVVNLAAHANVSYSIKNPSPYIDSNIVGFSNLIECCRINKINHLVYASTSSVYGANQSQPFNETQNVNHPMAVYAATKKCNELLAHTYSHLYNLPTTGLRFFTVYGPWGRPDMALFIFTKNILANKKINVFNRGNMFRDFTYIDDIVEGISRALKQPAACNPEWDPHHPDPSSSLSPYQIYNIGSGIQVPLIDYIHAIENALNKNAQLNLMPLQAGDMLSTHADTDKLARNLGAYPTTTINEGVAHFVKWYREFYNV